MFLPLTMSLFCWLLTKAFSTDDCTYTYQSHTGNRVFNGKGSFPKITPLTITHASIAGRRLIWLLGKQARGGSSYWFASDESRNVWTFRVGTDLGVTYLGKSRLPTVLFLAPFEILLPNDTSPLSHPVCINTRRLAYVANNGDLVLIDKSGREIKRRELNVLLDARLVLNTAKTLLAVYASASDQRYVHGVLGDNVEGGTLRLLRTRDLSDHSAVHVPENAAFEGISPFWADINGDGADELFSTVSNEEVGAAIYVADDDGIAIGRTNPIGLGSRWRHQLAVAPFGPNKQMELVDVMTPHLGKTLQMYQLNGEKLQVVAKRQGYASHQYGSRNLDMAVAGDFNGDGQMEMVVPSSSFSRVVALQRVNNTDTLMEVWSFFLGGQLTSNLAPVQLSESKVALGAGLSGGRIRLFMPA